MVHFTQQCLLCLGSLLPADILQNSSLLPKLWKAHRENRVKEDLLVFTVSNYQLDRINAGGGLKGIRIFPVDLTNLPDFHVPR